MQMFRIAALQQRFALHQSHKALAKMLLRHNAGSVVILRS